MMLHGTFEINSIIILSLVTLALLVACGNSPQTHRAKYDTLILTLQADRSQLRAGETVHIRFAVTNEGNLPWIIESQDTPVLDITVQDFNNNKLLLSWATQNPDKRSDRVEWTPRESKVLELEWAPQTELPHIPGQRVHISGTLNENGNLLQAAGVDVCVGLGCQ